MRTVLSNALVECANRPEFVFLTGDLGFMALEPVQAAAGQRFINAGIAEQNMVSLAAGMARMGLRPWVYSIAPFVYARAFEQIRNDICLHGLRVVLVGNGGGYAYGVMGSTHHALEDYGALLTLPNLKVCIPAFGSDITTMVSRMATFAGAVYLRLGRDESPPGLVLPRYAAWRRVLGGSGPTLLVVGPLAGGILAEMMTLSEVQRPSVWVLTELPIDDGMIPEAFVADLRRSERLIVVEEHVAQGGVGPMLASALLARGVAPRRFEHRCAVGYPSGRYGSQKFHRRESGIDPQSIRTCLEGKV